MARIVAWYGWHSESRDGVEASVTFPVDVEFDVPINTPVHEAIDLARVAAGWAAAERAGEFRDALDGVLSEGA